MNQVINSGIQYFIDFANHGLMPFMLFAFIGGIFMRTLIYYTVRRELWFVREFEKRVYNQLELETEVDGAPFYKYLRKLLEKTFYEVFELRARYRRRNPDYIMSLSDRLFLIQDGSARLIRDTLKHLKYHDRNGRQPQMIEVSKLVFNTNPAFSRVLGIVPSATINSLLDLLPGLFIICGIFGTFIGIMHALPQLSGMDLSDGEKTKTVMDGYLTQVAYSLSASIFGILLSVLTNVYQNFCDPEGLFISIVDRYSSALTVLWNRCSVEPGTVFLEETEEDFATEEEAFAHEAVERQLAKQPRVNLREQVTPQVYRPNPPKAEAQELHETEGEFTLDEAPETEPAPLDDNGIPQITRKKSA